MSESTTLGALVAAGYLELGDGYRTKRSEHGRPGLPILRVAEVLDGKILPAFEDYVSDAYRRAMGAKISRPGDVVLTTKGTVGRVAIIPDSSSEFVYSPQLCYFRVDPDSPLDARYLYYWFRSDFFWSQAGSRKSQTDMADYINLADIRSLRISLPSFSDQRAVVEVLGALDEKIEVNERIARNAAELAEAQFALTTAAAPRLVLVGDVAEFHNRHRIPLSSKQRSEMPGRYPYYGANGIVDHVGQFIFDGHYVLVGEDGSVVSGDGTPVVHDVRGAFWVNNHAHVLTGNSISNEILLVALRLADVRPLVTGAVQPKLSMGNLKKLPLALPSESLAPQLESQLRELFALAESRSAESHTLAELRDALLPGLMSGAIRVRDAEKAVEDAT
ncbi:type I restriction enzyme, S subunit [Micromonospora citrea]|uniref:Type I restriction enzyme, S subunit n=1 Tax=Micromonospora citrea TaxID=47855 RepID=A0A1C6TSY9_9ACTN|nr:restriction endonuclease subunit S [Micromonospora citrea]SCL44924.1 type I restriction enzyme, S subunit [Micromonospora citrea]